MAPPTLRFLSLFVPNLDEARQRYAAIFGIDPVEGDADALARHPFAKRPPVVFDLGTCKLALYECDMRTTHPGDVGIGIDVGDDLAATAKRASAQQGKVFHGPKPIAGDARDLAVFMLPDRHFFEVVGKAAKTP